MKASEAIIATPCGADWRKMDPRGDTKRMCGECNKLVHDLSSMTERQARALLARPRNDGLCIRYLHDAHGNVWFEGQAPVVPVGHLVRRGVSMLAGAAALVAMPALIEACGGAPSSSAVSQAGASNWDFTPAMPSVGATEDGGTSEVDGGSPTIPIEAGNDGGPEAGEPSEAGTMDQAAPLSDAGAQGGD
jgi:hypothetical protein